jgi:hypothetical protein
MALDHATAGTSQHDANVTGDGGRLRFGHRVFLSVWAAVST